MTASSDEATPAATVPSVAPRPVDSGRAEISVVRADGRRGEEPLDRVDLGGGLRGSLLLLLLLNEVQQLLLVLLAVRRDGAAAVVVKVFQRMKLLLAK